MTNDTYPSAPESDPAQTEPHQSSDPDPYPDTDVAPDPAAGVGDPAHHPDPPAGGGDQPV